MQEVWKPIAGFEGRYEVSNLGHVKSLHTEQIMAGSNSRGYRHINLFDGKRKVTKWVHHLVLEAFIGPRPSGYQGNHKDGIKPNNRLSNLEWVTPSRNIKHAYENGLQSAGGVNNGRCKLTEAQVRDIRVSDRPIAQLAHTYKVHRTTITDIRGYRRWKTFK